MTGTAIPTTIPHRLIDLIPTDLVAEGIKLVEPIRAALESVAERLADYFDRCDLIEKELTEGIDVEAANVAEKGAVSQVAAMLTGSQRVHDVMMDVETILEQPQ